MARPFLSYALTGLILVSQVGLPVHAHYCQGMLESISVLFSPGCNEHAEKTAAAACCRKDAKGSCDNTPKDCCDDEMTVLLQDVVSVAPNFDKWDLQFTSIRPIDLTRKINIEIDPPVILSADYNDSGPPIYIRCHSLIYYA